MAILVTVYAARNLSKKLEIDNFWFNILATLVTVYTARHYSKKLEIDNFWFNILATLVTCLLLTCSHIKSYYFNKVELN